MFIRQIIIEGVEGDVAIKRTERGAEVIANDVSFDVDRNDTREERCGVAWNVTRVLCGEAKRGEPNATNSMIHDVLMEIERIAQC
jgi:hypothetical protein